MKLIDKDEVLAAIKNVAESNPLYVTIAEKDAFKDGVKDALESVLKLEVKAKIEESEPTHFATSEQNEDIEQYARNEADKFASKEYEYYNDIGLLKKGFYWGCKAGANWQMQQLMAKAVDATIAMPYPSINGYFTQLVDTKDVLPFGDDKVKVIVIKEA